MNLILLFDHDFISNDQFRITDRRFEHIRNTLRASLGDNITVGKVNGLIGTASITKIDTDGVILSLHEANTPPPLALPLTLIIALPRPKMVKRILQTCATMGVKEIIFINSFRVEKSYWQSPLLSKESVEEQLVLGLEQAKDTVMPTVVFEKRFKPFVEDRLPIKTANTLAMVAHPNSEEACPSNVTTPTTLVVGPEGGFIPYEIDKLIVAGCQAVHLGQRILRVETAITVLLARLFH